MKHLIYLAAATAITFWTLALAAQTVETPTDKILTPAEYYAQVCEREQAKLKQAGIEPTPIPANVLRDRIENPFPKLTK